MYKILEKITTDDIEIVESKNEIQILSGRAKVGFVLQEKITLPLEEVGDQIGWKKIPEKFMDALKFTVFSCSKDASHPALTCINVNSNGNIEASDDLRITRYKVGTVPTSTFLIPASSVNELVKYDCTHISEGRGWVHFKTKEGTVFSCRVFEDTFPDITKLLVVNGPQLKLPKTIDEILERASIFSKKSRALEGEEVTVSLKANRVTIRADGESGWFEEEANMGYSLEPVSFSINPILLKDIIEEIRACTLGKNSIRFEGENWEHIISLYAKEAKK